MKLYDRSWHDPRLLHFAASDNKNTRLLNHFYATLLFTEPAVDNYYKRFVRDFMRYKDEIYCAAGKIVQSLMEEGSEIGGTHSLRSFSTLHVRRGEFQYKKVKIPAEEWRDNTADVFHEKELLFIATDERDRSFFDPLKNEHELRFLDDYGDLADLATLDPNYFGMIDTIVASHGRMFSGTWFSTFTGYITRMRGYLGIPLAASFYGTLDRKTALHEYVKRPLGNYFAREWPTGWVGIDGDSWAEGEYAPKDKRKASLEEGASALTISDGIVPKLPMDKTPALANSKAGHVQCETDVDDILVYWNDPQGTQDIDFEPPFTDGHARKYLTFEPDQGGWNNIRMSLEIIIVIAAATGRTLVLPPKKPFYLLKADKDSRERGFGDFFPLHSPEFNHQVPVLTAKEFLELEGGPDGVAPLPEDEVARSKILNVQEGCLHVAKASNYCGILFQFYKSIGHLWDLEAAHSCVVFDEDIFEGRQMSADAAAYEKKFCGSRRVTYYNSSLDSEPVLHLGDRRLLRHFYSFLAFTNPSHENHFKRLVRDFLRYHDEIWCAAGKIVKALREEGKSKGFYGAGYSSLHVRRGDLQYKQAKISAEDWVKNVGNNWLPNEILYIATDERNTTFFDPLKLAGNHTLRFLDDYADLAGLSNLDPNFSGMLDVIVASRGRTFAGTHWSTFSGYINRLRGYYGMTMKDSFYGTPHHVNIMHKWSMYEFGSGWAHEMPEGWIGIDGEVRPTDTAHF